MLVNVAAAPEGKLKGEPEKDAKERDTLYDACDDACGFTFDDIGRSIPTFLNF